MSKIALTPNASGTGVFTIASPATSTDRTLTLPDEAGTVLTSASSLASANLTGAVTVSGSNVGIGTASPSFPLSVQSNSNAEGLLILGRSSDDIGEIEFRENDNSTVLGELQYRQDHAVLRHRVGDLRFATGGVTERMRIDSSGNVGIGTSSPTQQLDVTATGATNPIIVAQNTTASNGGAQIRAGNPQNLLIMGTDSNGGGLTGTANSSYFYTTSTSPIVFLPNATERMRIDSSGNVLVGTTNATGRIVSNTTGAYPFVARNGGGTSGYFGLIEFRNNADNAAVGSVVRVNDNSTAYNTSSDYRLKTDAQPMTGASDRVLALKPVNFEWISSGDRVDGFLAHEAQAIVPEAVTGTKDAMRDEEYEVTAAVYEDIIIAAVLDEEGNEIEAERTEQRLVTEAVMGTRSVPDYQGIDQSKLVPLLTAALQEALTEISALKVRVAALEAV